MQHRNHFSEIVALAKDRTRAGRRRMAGSFSQAYLHHSDGFSRAQHAIALDIIAALIKDAELEVRRELAQRLAEEPTAPRRLVLELAQDVADVAVPVLKRSPVLNDADLISIVEQRGTAHRAAIASRMKLNARVIETLSHTRDPVVMKALLSNQSVGLPDHVMRALAEQTIEHTDYGALLLARPELTGDLASHLYWLVTQELRAQIRSRFDLSPTLLDRSLEQTIKGLTERDADPARRRPLVDRLVKSGAVNASWLIQLLRNHATDLFKDTFAGLTKLGPEATETLYLPEALQAFALVCRALGYSKSESATLIMLVRDRVGGQTRFDPAGLADAMAAFTRLTEGDARTVLWQWQASPEYLVDLHRRAAEAS